MKLDSTELSAIALGNQDTLSSENISDSSVDIVEGNDSESAGKTGPEVGEYTDWHYLFIHHRKVQAVRNIIEKDGNFPVFIHKTVIYSMEKKVRVSHERPTINGLVFIQGETDKIRKFLLANLPWLYLVNDCSTGKAAVITDAVMRPFMRVMEIDPTRVRFMLKPISKYGEGNQMVRITSGIMAGLEGYLIRIDRDRRLVMSVGNMTVAISGVHKEKFEEA